jgi:hypothetical protein
MAAWQKSFRHAEDFALEQDTRAVIGSARGWWGDGLGRPLMVSPFVPFGLIHANRLIAISPATCEKSN